jgi:hypothetical protein
MIEESAKQMTWHKNRKRYNPEKMVHPSDVDAWKYFNARHLDKEEEAHNVSNPIYSLWYWEFVRQEWHQLRDPTPHEHDTLLSDGAGAGRLDFIDWFKQKVLSNLACTFVVIP